MHCNDSSQYVQVAIPSDERTAINVKMAENWKTTESVISNLIIVHLTIILHLLSYYNHIAIWCTWIDYRHLVLFICVFSFYSPTDSNE